jgi:hypothetical protein
MNIREWQEKFKAGEFETGNPWDANWYDWWCKDESLRYKTELLGKRIVKKLKNSSKINLETMEVGFKNNCPMVGKLYDDIRISDIDSPYNKYVIVYNDDREDTLWTLYEINPNGDDIQHSFKGCNDVVAWLNS